VPLGMKDTAFSVPPEKVERFSSCYAFNPQTRELALQDDARGNNSRYTSPPAFQSGGGGLVSTLDDYLAFGRMMLNDGKLGNERVLSRPSIEAMTTDYLTPEQKRTSGWFPASFEQPRSQSLMPSIWHGRGWGLCMAVVTERLGPTMTPGRFGWDGAFGTMWWADPKEEMNMILMVQNAGGAGALGTDFLMLAYAAIDD
jgi:CubicO group peptidase (beta-lactamase class C family)